MSSPFTYGEPSPRTLPGATEDGDDDHAADIPRRLMRVKILYTFDDHNKTYCLARLPNALNIPAVIVDEDTQVGVIELRTCIEAIVAASPELVARLGHDYTVYAYDYSEYETPLVGQGMLSWILASASSTPNAPAGLSQTMVTGKVCKNILGLFNNGVKETLEVKLKLVPVPTFLQSEYLESMERYRSISKVLPEGFDHSSWTAFLKANPEFNATAAQITAAPQTNYLQRTASGGVESLHQLLTQNMPNESRRGSQYAMSTTGQSCQGSRAASPTPSFRSSHALQQANQTNSRPVSRASHTSDRQITNPQQSFGQPPSFNQQQSFESNINQEMENEEGPPRKRARVVQTDWRGKSNFGPRADSLRITASTAASIRVHKPAPSNLLTGGSNSHEPPPRAPTPIPDQRPKPRGRLSISGSSLRKEASNESLGTYVSPYGPRPAYTESVAASEDDQMADAEYSPADFPSSPPVYTQNNESPVPSSPGLPTLPFPDDSGFMSGSMFGQDEDFDLNNADKNGLAGRQANPSSAAPPPDQIWQMEFPGPAELLPKTVRPPPLHYKHQRRAERSEEANSDVESRSSPKPETRGRKRNSTKPPPQQPPQHRLAPLTASSPQQPQPAQTSPPAPLYQAQLQHSQSLPANSPPASQAVLPSTEPLGSAAAAAKASKKTTTTKFKKLPRSNTWSAPTPQYAQSEEPCGNGCESRSTSPRPRSGAGAKRKKLIEERLLESIEEGKMPDFCACCGQIQTPTWRKAFVKTIEGAPEEISISLDEPGAIVGFEIVEPLPDEVDFVPKYRVFKKSLTNEDKANKEFATMLLCNPCGLYFAKVGKMRPREKWEPKMKQEPKKRGRPRRRKPTDNQTIPTSDIAQEPTSTMYPDGMSSTFYTDQVFPSDAMECPNQEEAQQVLAQEEQRDPNTQPHKGHSNMPPGWDDASANAALIRAIQSSPPRVLGSQESPINLEGDLISPKPTRRLLFSSPRKDGEVKSLEDGSKDQPTITKQAVPAPRNPTAPENAAVAEDKENMPPPADNDDGLRALFEETENNGNNTVQATPKSSRSSRVLDILKTPSSKSKRAALTPKDANQNTADPFGFNLTSPKNPMTPFTASMHALFGNGTNKTPKSGGRVNRDWFSSPGVSKLFDFSDFDFDVDNTDLPFPSSPSSIRDTFNFPLYEDPIVGSSGFWGAPSVFNDSDPVQSGTSRSENEKEKESTQDGSVGVELGGIIDEVTKSSAKGADTAAESGMDVESEEVSLVNMANAS